MALSWPCTEQPLMRGANQQSDELLRKGGEKLWGRAGCWWCKPGSAGFGCRQGPRLGVPHGAAPFLLLVQRFINTSKLLLYTKGHSFLRCAGNE